MKVHLSPALLSGQSYFTGISKKLPAPVVTSVTSVSTPGLSSAPGSWGRQGLEVVVAAGDTKEELQVWDQVVGKRRSCIFFQQLKPFLYFGFWYQLFIQNIWEKSCLSMKYLTSLPSAVGWESSQSTCESPRTPSTGTEEINAIAIGKKPTPHWFGKCWEWFMSLVYHGKKNNFAVIMSYARSQILDAEYFNMLGSMTSYVMEMICASSSRASAERCSGLYPPMMKVLSCGSSLPLVARSFGKLVQVFSASFSLPAVSSHASTQLWDPWFGAHSVEQPCREEQE